MSAEPNKPIEQDYHYQVDQQVSVNAFVDVDINGETVRFQVTNRYGSTPEKIIKTTMASIEAYTALRQQFPRQLVQTPAPQEPQYEPIDDGGNKLPEVKTATAGRLSIEMKDGRFYYKVMDAVFAPGERGTKFGVSVYPEVLQAAGLTVNHEHPDQLPVITGWRVDYVCNEKGYPQKVTRLIPNKPQF